MDTAQFKVNELKERVDILYFNAYPGLIVSFFASTGMAFGFEQPSTLKSKLIWWLLMVTLLTFRFIDLYYFKKRKTPVTKVDLYRFCIGVILTALLWSSYALYFHVYFDVLELASTIIILSSLGGGSGNILSAHRATCIAYAFILLVPYSIVLLVSEQHFQNVLGILGLTFGIVTAVSLNRAALFTLHAIRLKNQNTELLEDMEYRVELRTQEIYHLSNTDSLTQLLNRNAFIKGAKKRIKRHPKSPFALLFIDLDGFKHINDTMGHKVGDSVLEKTARKISQVCIHNQQKCRWGGDEFLILSDFESKETTYAFAKEIVAVITQNHSDEDHKLGVGATIGIALYPEHGKDLDALILNADMAMYYQKRVSRGEINYFSEDIRSRLERKRRLSERLLTAIVDGELSLVYQPIVDAKTYNVYAVEALLRWHLEDENIPPDEFIPIAEQYGMITEIGLWVLDQACKQAIIFQKILPTLSVSINVSVIQLKGEEFVIKVAKILDELSFPANKLHIEITESVFAQDKKTFLLVIKSLQELGVIISIDDFGTGYSSLSSMLDVGVDKVKIDKSFVQDPDERGLSIVNAVVQMAGSLKFDVIAEGVETLEQSQKLTFLGVSHLQGYYFSKPLNAMSLINYLNNIKKAS